MDTDTQHQSANWVALFSGYILPDFISQFLHSRDKIWEWPGNEATKWAVTWKKGVTMAEPATPVLVPTKHVLCQDIPVETYFTGCAWSLVLCWILNLWSCSCSLIPRPRGRRETSLSSHTAWVRSYCLCKWPITESCVGSSFCSWAMWSRPTTL